MYLVSPKISVDQIFLITSLAFLLVMITMDTSPLEVKSNDLACDPSIPSFLLESGSYFNGTVSHFYLHFIEANHCCTFH